LREWRLKTEPLCRECVAQGIYDVVATEVDHIEPHRGDWSKFVDRNNLQSLCKSHHSKKTAKERREDKKNKKARRG
jgi:5-methylcytosine-specific restriction protein A